MSDRVGGDNKSKGKRQRKALSSKPSLSLVSDIPVSDVVVPLANGQGKNTHGLTAKQEAFAQGVGTRGETLATAYRAAYDAENMAPATVHSEACRLMANPAIAARINVLVREKQAKTSLDAARIRAHVIERLHLESIDPDSSPAARVRALELLGKLDVVGAFRDRVQAEQASPMTEDLAATLEARLKSLLAKTG